ncbi:MAG: three-Cys-motif partner protein TcmP [Planctomycetota bacterium]|nr:three-Cys-motif partner protein TcmP [Planctomycetota bacterium]MCX5674592.1 three-Cys-motif partner protein TcmP [Planctomycetota bacterium]
MPDNSFFDETREQSGVKATIVAKYFWAWARVIAHTVKRQGGKIAYLDLFAGPGRYKDGTASTPLLVLQKAIADPELAQLLVTIFNDRDEANSRSLETAIRGLPGIEKLKHQPMILNEEVGNEMVKMFSHMKLVPTLFFVDPWGYKGLSLGLVNAVVKDWACECIFFFNYNRVRMGLGNTYVEDHMNALFGKDKADALRAELRLLDSGDCELAVVERLCQALDPDHRRFVLPFRFRSARGTRTSHHLIFVTKHFRGYDIMKRVMAGESSLRQQGVATFEYNPADKRFPVLFELARPLDELEGMLLATFAGKKTTFPRLYEAHSVGKPYIDSNYRQVLEVMVEKGLITAQKPDGRKRRKGTFADDVVITFPQKGS